MIHTLKYEQNTLANWVRIPPNFQNNFQQLTIETPQLLTIDEIKAIAATALSYSSYKLGKTLSTAFTHHHSELASKGISYTVKGGGTKIEFISNSLL